MANGLLIVPTPPATDVTFDPAGLIVVTGTNVQTAIEQLDNKVSNVSGGFSNSLMLMGA